MNECRDATNKQPGELKKKNTQQRKEWESIRNVQIEIQEIKNVIQIMSKENNQCEDRVSDLEDRTALNDQLIRHNFSQQGNTKNGTTNFSVTQKELILE